MKKLLAISMLIPFVSFGQIVFITENNYNDLNPSRDQLSGTPGTYRIHHAITDGAAPVDLTSVLAVRLRVIDLQGSFTNFPSINATYTNTPGMVVWQIPSLNARKWQLIGDMLYIFEGNVATQRVFNRYLDVTNVPPVGAAVINMTNTFETSVVITNTVHSMSLVPFIPSNGSIGLVSHPWGEIHAVTGTFAALNIGDLNVEGSVTAADTGAVKLVGSVMTGPLTNEAGFFGDGSGLTNLNITGGGVGYTNLTSSGTGNVVTNIIEALGGIEYQLGDVAGGAASQWIDAGPTLSPTNTSTRTFLGVHQAGIDTNTMAGSLVVGSDHEYKLITGASKPEITANIIMRPRDMENDWGQGVGSFFGLVASNSAFNNRRGIVGLSLGNYLSNESAGGSAYPQFTRMANMPAGNYPFIMLGSARYLNIGFTTVATSTNAAATPMNSLSWYMASNDNDERIQWNISATGGNGRKRQVMEWYAEHASADVVVMRHDSSTTGRSLQVFGRLALTNSFRITATADVSTVTLPFPHRNTNWMVHLTAMNATAATTVPWVEIVATNRFNLYATSNGLFSVLATAGGML